MKRRTSPSSSAGFTLVEMLMAMLVMTVGLLGLLQSINVAYEHNLRNRLREQALLLGEEQMIQLRSQGVDDLAGYRNRSSASRIVAGVPRPFSVTRNWQKVGSSETMRYQVTVGWKVKGQDLSHVVYSLKRM